MPSFLSRLRNRAISQPSTHPVPAPVTPAMAEHYVDPAVLGLPLVPIDRKIRPDLNTLLEAYATEDSINRNIRSVTKQPPPKEELELSPLRPRSSGRRLIVKKSPDPDSSVTLSPNRGKPVPPRVLQPPPPGGTFGRHSTHFFDIAPASHFRSLPARMRPSQEKENVSSPHFHSLKIISRPSTVPNSGISIPSSSSTLGHICTDQYLQTPTRSLSPSNRTPSLRSSKSRSARISTPIARQLGFDSPRTLGYPTPPNVRASGGGASPPPLPPLDHPEFSSRSAISSSLTFGKSLLPHSGLPRLQSVFSTDSDGTLSNVSRPRANTMSSASTKASRRSSAEWSANQASAGVLSNSGGWPAEVSREILRLSLGEISNQQDPGNNRVSHVVREVSDSKTSPQTFTSLARLSSPPGSPIFRQSVEPVLPNPDRVATEEPDKRMSKVPEVTNGQPNTSTKGKAPLKSSLRMKSAPVTLTSQPITSGSRSSAESLNATPTFSKGKRKAEEVDITPSDRRSIHAKFDIPEAKSRRASSDDRAPSSYRVKRARLSGSGVTPTPSPSKPGTSLNAANTGSWTSRTSSRTVSRQQSLGFPSTANQPSRSGSVRSNLQGSDKFKTPDRPRSMSSISHSSIPLSALVSPHAPSVTISMHTAYHMQDPRRPHKIQPTSWSLRFRSEDEDGSPVHAWFFFVGFVVFPAWWVASLWKIPKTRQVGGEDMENAVTLDDPQVEHDARSWRFRCRVMSAVSIVTYIPFIVLVVVFAP